MQSGNGWHRWSNCKLQGECWSSVKAGAKRLWGTVIQSENCFGALCLSFYNDLFHVCNWVVTGFPSVLLVYPSGHCMCIVEWSFKGRTIWQLLHRSYCIFCWCLTWYELGFFSWQVVHALSVSLNKLGDLKYYAQDLEGARAFYAQALDVRVEATQDFKTLSPQVHLSTTPNSFLVSLRVLVAVIGHCPEILRSEPTSCHWQVLDVAVSLAKVADVDRALGNESAACEGFQEAVKKLEGLSMPKNSENSALAKRVMSSFKKLSKSVSLFSSSFMFGSF